jgi:hypothetical protein
MKTQSGFLQGVVALATALLVSSFSTAAEAYTADQQQACTGDAFRLCGSAIPNVDRVTACMVRQQAQLSPGCRAFFRSSEPIVRPVTARTQHRLHKPVRAHSHHTHKKRRHRV